MHKSITIGRLAATALLGGAALIIGIGTAFAATTVVTPASLNGWYFYNDLNDQVLGTSTEHGFVTGPGTPPIGTGSVHLTKTTTDKYGIATAQFAGTPLSSITSLKFSTYRASGTSAQAPSLGFDVDTDNTAADTVYEGRLTYEPYFTQTVTTGSWQTWDALNDAAGTGTGNWWFSHATPGNVATSCTQSDPCTWAQVLAAFPHAAMRSPGQLILRTNGADNEAFDGNVDNLTVGISGSDTTFDFDPAAAAPGSIHINKYACDPNTVVTRADNGVGGTVPAGCTPMSGATFGYVHGTQTDANAPYPEVGMTPTAGGATDNSGALTIGNLEATGRYLVEETDSNNQQITNGDVLGLYCQGDGDTSGTNDNQELTFVTSGGTANCVAYDKAAPVVATTSQVTIVKYVDGAHATTENADGAVFPFTATYQASNVLGGNQGSDPFTIGPVGNGTDNAYEAKTIPLAHGAMYNATESTSGNDVVGASCADGKSFALNGYSSGDTLQDAISGTQSSTSPTFANLQSDKFVVVWNVACATQPVSTVPPANACETPNTAPEGYTLKKGTSGNDTVTLAPNTMYVGRGGNDRVSGGDGNYIVCTAGGNDTITLGNGNSTVDAGAGNNKVTVGNGEGAIMSGNGNDIVSAGDGARTVSVGNGNNQVTTGDGAQTITAGSGNDQISAGDGDDTVNAGGGNNKLWGEGGADMLTAAAGNDRLDGGAGTDTCQAGGGNNVKTSCEL
jgi:hypothetical protein